MISHFSMKNPNVLSLFGSSNVPLNRGRGPELNTAYVLWERAFGVEAIDAIKNPTVENHAGWNMVSKGIFKGFEAIIDEFDDFGQKIPNQDWHPIMVDEIVYDPVFNVPLNHREIIKFRRKWRTRYNRFNDPVGERPTNEFVSGLFWQKILNPSKHPEFFRKRGIRKGEELQTFLTKGNDNNQLNILGDDILGKFNEYLGGKKNTRRTKKNKTNKKTKNKTNKTKTETKTNKTKTKTNNKRKTRKPKNKAKSK